MAKVYRGDVGKKAASAEQLASFFEKNECFDGALYIGYPIIGTAEGPHRLDALLVSPSRGLVVFHLIEGRGDIPDDSEAIKQAKRHQDDDYNKLAAKLRLQSPLMKGRDLQVPIESVTFAPVKQFANHLSDTNGPTIVHTEVELKTWIEGLKEWSNHDCYDHLRASIESISSIRSIQRKRKVEAENSLGRRLQNLENSIVHQDMIQAKAVIETTKGVQRIRGLAGSGKTIVLARKAAYLHACHPEWRIAVTFNTRSMKGQLREYIKKFTYELAYCEPDWDKLHVIQAWGAPGGGDKEGIYHRFCQKNDITYKDFGAATQKCDYEKAFEEVCKEALVACPNSQELYEMVLVDEAQDLAPSFLRMCYEMLSPEKRLVYAYDELQNLGEQSLPSPEDIFGKDANGSPKVTLTKQPGEAQKDIILNKCYRNSRPVLATAHALGFGIYRKPEPREAIQTGLVQIFDRENLWAEVGYEVLAGELEDGKNVTLARSQETSPLFLEEHSTLDELIQFKSFDSQEEQDKWVTQAIKINLEQDELCQEDILVVHPSPFSARKSIGTIRTNLSEAGIKSHFVGVTTAPDRFSDPESIAVSGIYRAKGNEVGMVYVVNAQECCWPDPIMRNQLFTAITRSKAWVRVLGHGQDMKRLIQEFAQIKQNDFKLKFRYPTAKERQQLKTLGQGDKNAIRQDKKGGKQAIKLLKRLDQGEIQFADLSTNEKNLLKNIVANAQGE